MCGLSAVTSMSEFSRCLVIRFSFGRSRRHNGRRMNAKPREELDRRQNVVQHNGLVYVQLKFALRTAKATAWSLPNTWTGDHGEGFALSGIDLSRHDRGSVVFRLSGILKFAGSRTRTTSVSGHVPESSSARPQACATHRHGYHAVDVPRVRQFVGSEDKGGGTRFFRVRRATTSPKRGSALSPVQLRAPNGQRVMPGEPRMPSSAWSICPPSGDQLASVRGVAS